MCHGCVYTGSFELDYPHTQLAALHVHRRELPYRAFPERVGPRVLSLSVVYFGTTDRFSGRKKKRIILMRKTSRFPGKSESRIEESGIEDRLKRT